jgi:hypothetical protein
MEHTDGGGNKMHDDATRKIDTNGEAEIGCEIHE